MPLTEQDTQDLLSFLRVEVSRSRFSRLDAAVMESALNYRGLQRVIRYLDLFVQMVSERSSGAVREIEGTLGQFIEVEEGRFEGVEIELTPFESELRKSTFLSLRDLGDNEDLIVLLRQLLNRLKEETESPNGFETDEN